MSDFFNNFNSISNQNNQNNQYNQNNNNLEPKEQIDYFAQAQEEAKQALEQRARNKNRYQIVLADDEYEYLNEATAKLEDPATARLRIGTAKKISQMYQIPFDEAYTKQDEIQRALYGDIPNDPTIGYKRISDAFQIGMNNVTLGKLGVELMQAELAGDTEKIERLNKEIKLYDDENNFLNQSAPKTWVNEIAQVGATSFPYTMASAVPATLLGLLHPAAGIAAGTIIGGGIVGGQEYIEMRKAGYSPKIAASVSAVSGVIQGLIEQFLGEAGKIAGAATGRTVNKIFSDSVKKSLVQDIQRQFYFKVAGRLATKLTANAGKELGEEGAEEVFQGLVSIGGKALANHLEGNKLEDLKDADGNTIDLNYIWNDVVQNAKGGIYGAIALGGIPGAINTYGTVKQYNNLKAKAKEIHSPEMFANYAMNAKDKSGNKVYENVTEGMSESKAKTFYKDLWREQQNGDIETENAKAQSEVNRSAEGFTKEDEESEEYFNETKEARNEDGDLITQDDRNTEGTSGIYKVGDSSKGEDNLYGFIKYNIDKENNTVEIEDFVMNIPQERLRQEFYNKFAEDFAGFNITWETKGDVAKSIKDSIIANNPNGEKAGLTYYSTKESVLDKESLETRKQAIKDIMKVGKELGNDIVVNKTHAAFIVGLTDAYARNNGMTFTDYYYDRLNAKFADVKKNAPAYAVENVNREEAKVNAQGKHAKVQGFQVKKDTVRNGESVIYVTENGDRTTLIHELAHTFRENLNAEQLAEAEKVFGVQDHDWKNTEITFADGHKESAEEAFARAMEDIVSTGKLSDQFREEVKKNGKFREIMQKFIDFLARYFKAAKQYLNMTPDIENFFNELLKTDGSEFAKALKAVEELDKEEFAEKQKAKKSAEEKAAKEKEERKEVYNEKEEKPKTTETVKNTVKTEEELDAEKKATAREERRQDIQQSIVDTINDTVELSDDDIFYEKQEVEDAETERQIEAVRKQYEGTEKWLKAPNGKDSNLNEKQWLQVRTPNFKAWFGDWENDPQNASKAIDENGEPKVVYHGTPHTGFAEFNTENGYIFFADTEGQAESYSGSNKNPSYTEDNDDSGIYRCFLNIKNPKVIDFEGLTFNGYNEDGDFVKDIFTDAEAFYAREEGYDGTIFKNVYYDRGDYRVDSTRDTEFINTEYVAFSSNNIKSATDNNGDFNASNPNINFQILGEKGAKALDTWENVSTRIDNLALAKDMEKAGKDAKTIRLATSWEKGIDGKWRYETDDSNVNFYDEARYPKRHLTEDEEFNKIDKAIKDSGYDFDKINIQDRQYWESVIDSENEYVRQFIDFENGKETWKKTADLERVLNAPELFKAYPELKTVQFKIEKLPSGKTAEFQKETNTIVLDEGAGKSSLLHEVQHAIQEIEGFEKGTSPMYLWGQGKWDIKSIENTVKNVIGDKIKDKADFDNLVKAIDDYAKDTSNESAAETVESIFNKYNISEQDQIKIADPASFAENAYKRTAGEVEARNVSNRMNFTAQERLNTLLADTQDVSPDDQIVIKNNVLTHACIEKISDILTDDKATLQEKANAVTSVNELKNNAQEMQRLQNVNFQIISEDTIEAMKENSDFAKIASEKLETAKHYESTDQSPVKIKSLTNWERDNNGKWIYETDDSSYKLQFPVVNFLKSNIGKKARLGDILKSDELYSVFPMLKEAKISFADGMGAIIATFNKDGITLNKNVKTSGKGEYGLKGVLAHEIQHFIQVFEELGAKATEEDIYSRLNDTLSNAGEIGFTESYALSRPEFAKYLLRDNEIEARAVAKRIDYDEGKRQYNLFRDTCNIAKDLGINLQTKVEDDILFEKKVVDEPSMYGIHNLSADNLRHVLKMGGIANPSLAVLDLNKPGFNNFGEISLIPYNYMLEKGEGIKGTFGADIYSPRYPRVENEVTETGERKINSILSVVRDVNKDLAEELAEKIKSRIENANGSLKDYQIEELGLQIPFLAEEGRNDFYKYDESKFSDEILDKYEEYKKGFLSDEKLTELYKMYETDPEVIKELSDDKGIINRNVLMNLETMLRRAAENRGKPDLWNTTKAAQEIIEKDPALKEKFKEYAKQKVESIERTERIFNGFTPSGNRRYLAHTLENVSKYMKAEGLQGGENFGYGMGSVRAQVTPKFTSLKQIKKAKDRLVSHDEFENIKNELNEQFENLIDVVKGGLSFDVGEARLEEAFKYGKGNIAGYLEREYNLNLSEQEKKDIQDFAVKLYEMPTEYFEAKYERPVYLNEFAGAVIPSNLDQDLKDALSKAGLILKEYDNADAREDATKQALKDMNESRQVLFETKYDSDDFIDTDVKHEGDFVLTKDGSKDGDYWSVSSGVIARPNYILNDKKRPLLWQKPGSNGIESEKERAQSNQQKSPSAMITGISDNQSLQQGDEFDNINFQKITDEDLIKKLDSEPTIKVYRAMQEIDGKLYPPMAAVVDGKFVQDAKPGEWFIADENPELAIPDIDKKTGKQKVDKKTGELKWKFNLSKGGKDASGKKLIDIPAAYNPYWHTSRSPLNDQFSSAYKRPNLVTVEVEIPESELTSGYKAERAKDAVGEVEWKSGVVSSKLAAKGNPRKVILSRYCKINRVIPNSEVASQITSMLKDTDIAIPDNTVTPSLLEELKKQGVKIEETEEVKEFNDLLYSKFVNFQKSYNENDETDVTHSQNFKNWFGDWENDPQNASKVVDEDGKPLVVYHETAAKFDTFDTSKRGAANSDYIFPHGIFTKPTSNRIGVAKVSKEVEPIQMALYANIKNPLIFETREEAEKYFKNNVPGYGETLEKIKNIDTEYNGKYEQADKHFDEVIEKFDKENPNASQQERLNFIDEASKELDNVTKEWESAYNNRAEELRNTLDEYFNNSDYDGIILNKDVGKFNRTVKTIVALNSNQIKSATDNNGEFDIENPNINFQTKEQVYKDALDSETWQDFMNYYETFGAEGYEFNPSPKQFEDMAEQGISKESWYKNIWELAHKGTDAEEVNKDYVESKDGNENFLNALKNDPAMLDDFLDKVNYINNIDFNSDEYIPTDAEEAREFDELKENQAYIRNHLKHGTWLSNAKRIGNGGELTERTRKTMLSLIAHNPEDYREIYTRLTGDDTYALSEDEKQERQKIFSLVNPDESIEDKSPEERKKIAEDIKDKVIADKVKNGTIRMDGEIERYISKLDSEIESLNKELNNLDTQTKEDYARIVDWEHKQLLRKHDELLKLKEEWQYTSDSIARKIDKGLRVTDAMNRKARTQKKNYDEMFRSFTELENSIELTAGIKEALDRQEKYAEFKQKIKDKESEKKAVAQVRKLRKQLVKRTMRNVDFARVDYENAKTICAIQEIFEPNLLGGVNKWIGTEGMYLRGIASQFITDADEAEKIKKALANKGTRAAINTLRNLNSLKSIADFDKWTKQDRADAYRSLPREDWIKELHLDELSDKRKSTIKLDIGTQTEIKTVYDDVNGKTVTMEFSRPTFSDEIGERVKGALGEDLFNQVVGKPFAEWTTEELEELAIKVNDLYKEGRDILSNKQNARKEEAEKIRRLIESAVRNTGIQINDDDTPEEKEQKLKKIAKILGNDGTFKGFEGSTDNESFFSKINTLLHGYNDATVRRVARILDNYSESTNVNELYRKADNCYKVKTENKFRRQEQIDKVMKENNITYNELFRELEFEGQKYTVDDLLFILAASEDYELDEEGNNDNYAPTARNAIAFGNLMSSDVDNETKASLSAYLEKEPNSENAFKALQGYIDNANTRFDNLVEFANDYFSKEQNQKLLLLKKVIQDDYENEFERIEKVSIEEFNQPVNRVRKYIPIIRKESNGDTNINKVKQDLLGANGTETGFKAGTDKGFTKNRVRFNPLHQKPIESGLYKTWLEQVDRTEHFIAYSGYVRELNRVYKSREAQYTRRFIENRYGKGMLKYLDDYINEIANPNTSNVKTALDEYCNILRGKAAPAYLAWKASSIIKQGLTSPAPFMQFVNPATYLSTCFDMMIHKDLYDVVREKSVFMKDRTFDPMIDAIKELMEKEQNKPGYALDKFNEVGMKGLEWIDWVCVAPGWLSCYRQKYNELVEKNEDMYNATKARLEATGKYTSENIDAIAAKAVNNEIENMAVQYADDCTRLCQPSSRKEDLAPLFKNSPAIARAVLQFQTSLNVIWNNIRYDLPYAVKNQEYKQAVGMVLGYVIAGILMNTVCEGLPTDDDEDKTKLDNLRALLYYSTTQFSESMPVIGQAVSNLSKQIITGEKQFSNGNDIFPMFTKIGQGTQFAIQGNWQKSAKNFAEGLGLATGLPVSGTKELLYMFGIGDGEEDAKLHPLAPIGRRNKDFASVDIEK